MNYELSLQRIGNLSLKRMLGKDLARTMLLKWFEQIQQGRITLVDGQDRFVFGQPEAKARVSAVIHVHDRNFYQAILLGGSVGAGESYMQGDWTSPDLVGAVRVMAMNIPAMQNLNKNMVLSSKLFFSLYSRLTRNDLNGSRKNISAHYDLGNDFFSLFLDPSMMYSSAVWKDESWSLEQASTFKLDLICQKLELKPGDHLIEIGTGWGAMAVHAAKHYGCKVSTTTISKEQYHHACELVKKEKLEDKVEVLFSDYRDLTGRYDKLVSIEMIEAVGKEYLPTFFKQCSNLLKPEGKMLIQSITISDQRYQQALKSVDFIQRYIFPGGHLPSVSVFSEHLAAHTDMQLTDLHDITHDYALTLREWRERYHASLSEVKALAYDESFIRMWDFYLAYCEGAFMERVIQTSQFLALKPSASHQAPLWR